MIQGAWPWCWHTVTMLPSGSTQHSTRKARGGSSYVQHHVPQGDRAARPPRAGGACRRVCCPQQGPGAGPLAGLVKFVWVATVLVWLIPRVLSIATFFQFVRMLYHWNTPGVYAGWSFLAYFAVLTAITYFVSTPSRRGFDMKKQTPPYPPGCGAEHRPGVRYSEYAASDLNGDAPGLLVQRNPRNGA